MGRKIKRYRRSPERELAAQLKGADYQQTLIDGCRPLMVLMRSELYDHVVSALPRQGLYGVPTFSCRCWPRFPRDLVVVAVRQDHIDHAFRTFGVEAAREFVRGVLDHILREVVAPTCPCYGNYPIQHIDFSVDTVLVGRSADSPGEPSLIARIAGIRWVDDTDTEVIQEVTCPADCLYRVSPHVMAKLLPFNQVVRGD